VGGMDGTCLSATVGLCEAFANRLSVFYELMPSLKRVLALHFENGQGNAFVEHGSIAVFR